MLWTMDNKGFSIYIPILINLTKLFNEVETIVPTYKKKIIKLFSYEDKINVCT